MSVHVKLYRAPWWSTDLFIRIAGKIQMNVLEGCTYHVCIKMHIKIKTYYRYVIHFSVAHLSLAFILIKIFSKF